MSEELVGKAGVEADHGFQPMGPSPVDPPKEEQPTFGSDHSGIEQAASELQERRAENNPPLVERDYHRIEDGEWGERTAPNRTVDPRRAARDLTAAREQEIQTEELQASADLASAVDEARSGYVVNPDLSVQQVPDLQPQPDSPAVEQPTPGVDPELARALQNPTVRAAVEAQFTEAATAAQTLSAATQQAAQVAAAAMYSSFPELASLTTEQLPGALELLSRTNPQRHAEVQAHLGRVRAIYAQHNQAKAVENAFAQQRFQQYADAQDKIFDEYVKDVPPAEKYALQEKVIELAESHYGIPREQLGHLWQTSDVLRSAAFQRMMLDATRYHMALERVKHPSPRPVPRVQRPGVSEGRPSADMASIERARSQFTENPNPKTAAAFLRARRAAS